MIFIVIAAVLLLYAGIVRLMGKDSDFHGFPGKETRRRTLRENTGAPVIGVAAADSEAENLAWTALDDLQLNRLLRDSW